MPKLISETNTPKAEKQIRDAFGMLTNRGYFPPKAETHYEHGQWWIFHPPTGRAWSVSDAWPGVHHSGIDFEELEEGEELSNILDIFKKKRPSPEEEKRRREEIRFRERDIKKRIEARGFIKEQIAKGNRASFAVNRFEDDVGMVTSLINSLYKLGAKRVDVYGVYREPDGKDHADTLYIDFPTSAQARAAGHLARSWADEASIEGKTLRLWWD